MSFIHPLAHVENSSLGDRTRVWQFASIIRGSSLGDDCNVASGTSIDGVQIGHRCIIGHNCSINPGIRIGNDVFIGPNTTFCNDGWPRVAKDGFEIEKLTRGEIITIQVEDLVSIGARVVIMPGVTIGHGSMIAAGVIVDRSVPPDSVFWRNGTISQIGEEQHRRMRPAR